MSKSAKCTFCESELNKITVGLNKKFYGRKITKFLCLQCLAEHLDVTEEDLLDKVEDFKMQGCDLF